jgi:hypothetical protein
MDFIEPKNIAYAIQHYRKGGEVLTTNYLTEIETIDEEQSIEYLTQGNWYKQNPSRLLGKIVVGKDRYGKEIQYLKGDISVLENIDVDTDFAQFRKAQGIGVTTVKSSNEELLQKDEVQDFVEGVISKSNEEIGKKSVSRIKKKQSPVEESLQAAEIQSFKEIYAQQNKNISLEELRCYVWYKSSIGQTLSDEWYELAEFGSDYRNREERIRDWVNDGILFYFKGELLPLPLYCSGNIYEKVNRLVKVGENSGADVEHIINTYGNEVLTNQLEILNNAFGIVSSKKLILTGSSDNNSLILKPISKFAKEFMIDSIESMDEFKWWESGRKETRGKIDYYKTDGREYKKSLFEKLSLTDAFCLWLIVNKNKLDIKGNITANDIIYFYIEQRSKQAPDYIEGEQLKAWKAQMQRTKSKAAAEGNRLFGVFLNTELSLNQKVAVETAWNSSFNNYLAPDFSKIPVAFNICKKFYDEFPFEVKPEKREAVSFLFNEGSGCLAYDVGVGKTISAIMAIEQFLVSGYSKRPFVVVPNQTYKQWLSEIKNALPHREVNAFFNLGVDYLDKILDAEGRVKMVKEGTITVLTYEGFEKIGFNEQTQGELMDELYEILNQGGESEKSDKKIASFREKLEILIGKGLKGTNIQIEDIGFDFVCFDEAHALKKVFTSVKGEQEKEGKKSKNPYKIQSGVPSNTALKGFMIGNYIFRKNNYRNVILLTATPFTNSPLEVFSMLALVAYHQLEKLGIKNITDFFDNFIDMSTELVINHKLKPEYRQIVKGFNNLPSLQRIILRYFNYKTGEDVGVVRPNKIVLPLVNKLVNGEVVKLPKEEQVTCSIELNSLQQSLMSEIVAYAEGKAELGYNASHSEGSSEEGDEYKDAEAEEVEEGSLNSDEKAGVRALRAMNFSRNLALSPYIYQFSGLHNPTYLEYINTSPKLKYVMECIKSVKQYHEERNEPISGQVIYMDRGLEYFNLLKEYLIYELGFEKHEVGEITSKMSTDKKRLVQDSFLGKKFNEKTMEYENLEDSQRVKVLLGSSSIKEGINLQKKATVLYNCFVDWNPTDMIQLQGRIWRQQNEFMNVRIVNPLMIDSMDIFMFQKLEEKTARLNTIWSNDGKSVLKLEEVDPEEIKYALIKDPMVIAMLESEQGKVKIEDDINSLKVLNERVDNYLGQISQLNYYLDKLNEMVSEISPSRAELSTFQKINFLVSYFKQEYPKDDEGRVMLDEYERRYNFNDILSKLPEGTEISPITKKSKPYWFSTLTDAKRLIEKENKDLFEPRNIPSEMAKEFQKENEDKIKQLEENLSKINSEDFIKIRAEQIYEDRQKNKFEIKPISVLVDEFKKLNYLLSIKRPKSAPNKVVKPMNIVEKIEHLINLL